MPTSHPAPVTDQPTGTADTVAWPTVIVRHADGELSPIPAEPTCVPGLVIVPGRHHTRPIYTGLWSLTHVESGLCVGPPNVPLVYARETAAWLATRAIDWTRPTGQVRADDTARWAFYRLLVDVHAAWDEGRPLWWRWPSVRPSSFGGFGIVCAAPLCGRHLDHGAPAVVTRYDEDTDTETPITFPTIDAGMDQATASGWRRHDKYALCRDCAADHTPNPNPDLGC